MAASIAKNTALMTVASVGQRLISFVYFTFVARMIGVEGTGKYFLALSFTTMFVVLVDLGLTNVLVREAAKAQERIQEYLSTVISMKIVLGILSYVGMVIAMHLLGYSVELRHMIYLSGVTMLFDSLHLTMYGTLRALGDLRYEAGSIIGSQLLTMILGSTFLLLGFPLIFLILAFTISSACNVLFIATVLWRAHRVRLAPVWHPETGKHLFRIAAPFAIAAVLARAYSYADSIMLSKLAGETAVGWYSIPYKMTFAFQFIPLALVAAVYPRFSEYFVTNKERLSQIFEQSMKYLLLVALPIAGGIAVLAREIVVLLYTDAYLPSVLPLQILIISLVFAYASFPIGALLNACDKQKQQTKIVAFVLSVNLFLNYFLIPQYGVVGAAIAALVGNILLACTGALFVPGIMKVSGRFFISMIFRLFVSVLVMSGVVWMVQNMVPGMTIGLLAAILAGVLVYSAMLFVTRAITILELKEAWALVRR